MRIGSYAGPRSVVCEFSWVDLSRPKEKLLFMGQYVSSLAHHLHQDTNSKPPEPSGSGQSLPSQTPRNRSSCCLATGIPGGQSGTTLRTWVLQGWQASCPCRSPCLSLHTRSSGHLPRNTGLRHRAMALFPSKEGSPQGWGLLPSLLSSTRACGLSADKVRTLSPP